MEAIRRWAVYWAPPEGGGLARAAAAWLGVDAATGAGVAHPALGPDLEAITGAPRRYGFHATLKPPFALADGCDAGALRDALRDAAARVAPFGMPPLRPGWLGPFLALVPERPDPGLAAFAQGWVEALDRFRAPPGPDEVARRRRAGLSARQEDLLARWGYPYVAEEFRFHLTLTGPLEPAAREAVEAAARGWFGPHLGAPVPVREVCLFGEGADGRFRIVERVALGG